MLKLYKTIIIKAGEKMTLAVYGDYLRLQKSAVEITLETDQDQFSLNEGDEATTARFAYIHLSHDSGQDQTISLYVGLGSRYGSAKVGGSVDVASQPNSPGSNAQKTVTTTSAQLVAANTARKYLLIQNKDGVGAIWITFSAEATQDNGVKIPPGGFFELNGSMLTGEIHAIGDLPTQSNVVVVEG